MKAVFGALALVFSGWSAGGLLAQDGADRAPSESARIQIEDARPASDAPPLVEGSRAEIPALDRKASADKPDLIPTEHFAGRPGFSGAKLSPDGATLTLIEREGGVVRLSASDPRTGELIDSLSFAKGTYVTSTQWVDKDKMLLEVWSAARRGPYLVRYSRLVLAYPREGRFEFLVEDQTGFNGGDVLHVDDAGEYAIIAHRGDGRLWQPSVYRYQLKPGGTVEKIVEPKYDVHYWIADDDGVVRLGMGWRKSKLLIFYREKEGDDFKTVARIKPGDEDSYFDALEILSNSNRGYVLDENEEGRVGLRIFDYATREVVETFYEHPDWDIDEVWIEDGKPVAAFYTDDREQIVWFNEDDKAVYDKLKAAVGDSDVWVTSRSDNGEQLLVWAGNEGDPGVLYFYDAPTQSLSELAQFRPELDFRKLVRPKAFSYTARDGTSIRAFLTLPKGRDPGKLPLIILPHGGPFGIRDELAYDDQVQFLANRGYAVLQPNFRGSGGYGSEFYDLGVGEVGRGMQDDLDDAMDWAVKQGIADPERVCVVGGSYGGYAALWAVLRNPERYRCAASWAGVTDWTRMLKYDRRVLTRSAGKRWTAKIKGDEGKNLKDVSPYRLADNLSRPVLLAHGTLDDNVPFKQYEQMVKAARKAPVPLTTLVIENEGHSFSRASSEQAWYDALDTFLAEHNPADQVDENGKLRAPPTPEQPSIFRTIELPGMSGEAQE
ncbi:MAG: S9 family peptidase [Pseudomonadota bacterium]